MNGFLLDTNVVSEMTKSRPSPLSFGFGIGARKPFIVVPERVWREHAPPARKPLGQWLVENMPRGINLEVPDGGRVSNREIPFADWDDEDWGDK